MVYACPAGFQPKVCAQVGSRVAGTGSSDCGPCATIEALYVASCGRHTIGNRERRAFLINKIRDLGLADRTGATDNDQMRRAYVSTYFANAFAALGLRPPRASAVFWRADFDTEFPKPQLQDGKWASVSVDYAYVNANLGITGDPNFNGNHQVVVGNLRTQNGVQWVTWVDPLMDGRRAGIADGPQAVRLSFVKGAADAYTGDGPVGSASGWAFWSVAPLLPPPDPNGTTTVPNIVNDPEATALADIGAAELLAGNREEAYHASIATGNVISQDPVATTVVNKQSTVDYIVSLGTEPAAPATDPEPPDPCGPAGPGCGC